MNGAEATRATGCEAADRVVAEVLVEGRRDRMRDRPGQIETWPSGAAARDKAAANRRARAGLFSTSTGCFHSSPVFQRRSALGVAEPPAKRTMIFWAFDG